MSAGLRGGEYMNHIAKVVVSALLFGCIAGASMVGVNVAAQRAGLIVHETQAAQNNTAAPAAPETSAADQETQSGGTAQTAGTGKTVSEISKEAMPSVVAITNMMKYQQNGYSIFGGYQSQETEVPASGSGIIVGKTDTELLIVTNNHVVTDSTSLSVTFTDAKSVNAAIKGTDANADLAVIAVNLKDIPTDTLNQIKVATLGNSDDVQVGDQVVAIGNALGYGQSVTTGIISAKDRDVETSEGTESGLMQTDAAINPGNSGGALLNMQGEVIGINVAKYSSTDVEGMGYSIPSAKAQNVIDNLSSLTTRAEVPQSERGYLGIQVKNIDKNTAASFGMPQGVFIYKFTDGSTAQNSGLQEKDIITALDGQGVSSYDDLQSLLSRYRAGETVTVTVQRPNGSKYDQVDVKVTLGTNPETASGSTGSQQNGQNSQGGQNAPDQNGQNGQTTPPDQNGQTTQPDQSGQSGQQGQNGDQNEELWKEFQQFFQQYQR